VGDPELLFLDEPTTGLDPQSRRQLWDVVTELKGAGKTVLLTTHYMDEAERLCDRVAIVDRGRIIALGTPRELVAAHVGQEIVEFQVDGAVAEPELRGLPAVESVRPVAGGWQLVTDRVHLAIPALLALLDSRGQAAGALSTHRATLEDVFVTLTGRRLRD
jgi:ABC-2 type transport system ATP-binding protein